MAMVRLRKFVFPLLLLSACGMSCKQETAVTKIAFGSCGHQSDPQPVLAIAAAQNPDAFIFLGDNIYGDTDNMDTLWNKYERLGAKPEYRQLAAATQIFATWDDHDFGRNDAGKYYPYKKESKEIFMEFFKEPANSDRRKHDGIYKAEYLQEGDKIIQLILLDVRSFRSDLLLFDKENKELQAKYFYPLDYQPHTSPDSSLLGDEQWKWLEEELKKPADLRFICHTAIF